MKTIIKIILLYLLVFVSTVFAQEAQKIEQFEIVSCEEYLSRMDNVFLAVSANLTSKICVFVYEGKELAYSGKNGEFKIFLPRFGQAKAKINSMIKRLSFIKRSANNLVFIEGGFRENLSVEFWLVPLGVEPPKPTPTLKKMKYRKGKPFGFCVGCCG